MQLRDLSQGTHGRGPRIRTLACRATVSGESHPGTFCPQEPGMLHDLYAP